MKLLIIRHATAVPRDTEGVADEDRPLTPKGKKRFRRAARGLARIVARPDVLLTSPLTRAVETAKIAATAWGQVKPTVEPALAGDNVTKILAAIEKHPRDSTAVMVGHEPTLSTLLARLLGCSVSTRLAFRKGGAALVDLPGNPGAGGRLLWYLPPRTLRTLGNG